MSPPDQLLIHSVLEVPRQTESFPLVGNLIENHEMPGSRVSLSHVIPNSNAGPIVSGDSFRRFSD